MSASNLRLGTRTHFELRVGEESIVVELPLSGRHNVANALAASALAHAIGVPLATIAQGLGAAPPVKGRLVRHALPGGWTLIDDSYNANPGSTAAAIDTLAELTREQHSSEAWLVLGDMRELGASAAALHAQASALAFGDGAQHFANQQELVAALAAQVHPGVTVLVKGSRGSAMDQVVRALLDGAGSNGGGTRHAA